jgi:GNAT superfamily N-acetyltransferase
VKIETAELTPKLWPQFEQLFGDNGACAGCWCMFWRLEEGERFRDVQGPAAKRRMKKLVEAGKAQGVLAFADGEPVGWLALGKRTSFAKLDRAPSLECDDAEQVWSLPCFFVHRKFRSQGVATALLAHGLKALKRRGAKLAEGYPVKAPKAGEAIPAAFAYTGTVPLFEKQGFEIVAPKAKGKQRARKLL